MNDKQIRKILIASLQAQVKEIRIYQEKNIGSSICDLMAVTGCLTGYEIKSGRDDYRQLQGQVNAYSRFFDRCYIVVGVEHRRSAPKQVPTKWGILAVEETGITVECPAGGKLSEAFPETAGGMEKTRGILARKLEDNYLALGHGNPYLAEIRKLETEVKKLRAEVET